MNKLRIPENYSYSSKFKRQKSKIIRLEPSSNLTCIFLLNLYKISTLHMYWFKS